MSSREESDFFQSTGPSGRAHTGHSGKEREFGRLTTSYDDAGPAIDVYASRGKVL